MASSWTINEPEKCLKYIVHAYNLKYQFKQISHKHNTNQCFYVLMLAHQNINKFWRASSQFWIPQIVAIPTDLLPSDCIWHCKKWLILLHVLACHLLGTKSLPVPLNAELFSIWPSKTKVSEILNDIRNFSFNQMHFKMLLQFPKY